MSSILDLVRNRESRCFEAGELILKQGETTDRLYFLSEGSVEVLKDNVRLALASEPGAVFGELSVLLNIPHSATVRAAQRSSFYVVTQPLEFLKSSPPLCLHVCKLLAQRLDALNKYLVDVKTQFAGHDHLGMVDEVLEALLHRTPKQRVRPRQSTIDQGELAD
jgi:CRP/FNR family transcriptional regulator, cyclic AMP receptor protein